MEQTWKDLANKYANVDKLIIAEVDCTKFEAICQQNNVRGYPTLSLFNNGKHIEKYNGNRDLNSFSDFLTPHLVKYHEDL
jgi:thioredoxin domain-containing protein 5